jgi:lysophospholipase L1-like esterase
MNSIIWSTQYNGQSPGDLQNLNNGYAGQFSGYSPDIYEPHMQQKSDIPTILIMGDSILGDYCLQTIRIALKYKVNVNFLRHPHHCKNIQDWFNKWKYQNWNYDLIFFFDGMHGFPNRVTEDEYQIYTPNIIEILKTVTCKILWCNCTPIPINFPQNTTNSKKGPNTKEQSVTDNSVINRNKSIQLIMDKHKIKVLNLYSIMKKIQHLTQPDNDIHFNGKGQVVMGKFITQNIYNMIFKN